MSRDMTVRLRPAVVADADACGRTIYAAFTDVDERHGFTSLFTSVQQATHVAKLFSELASMHGIVADDDGRVLGSVTKDDLLR